MISPTRVTPGGEGQTLSWRCPMCKATARLETAPEPTLACTRGHRFGSVDGILCLGEATNYADSFGVEWLEYARTQVDKFNGTHISRDRFFEYTQWPRDLRGQLILEAGSGSGRFTEVLLDAGATVVSFDYSAAVVANRQNNGDATDRLTLFRGDIRAIPFEDGTFDRVVCLGVLQHTPSPSESFASLARVLRPGGQLAVDVYRLAPISLLHPKYYVRPLRRLVPPRSLVPLVKRVVPWLLPLKAAIRRIPVLGVPLAHLFVPVPDYRGRLPLSDDQARIWSELDLLDWISPEHDHPATRHTFEKWFQDAGLTEVQTNLVSKGWQIVGRATRPAG